MLPPGRTRYHPVMSKLVAGMRPAKSGTGAKFVKAPGGAAVRATSSAGGHKVGGTRCAAKRAGFKTGAGKGY